MSSTLTFLRKGCYDFLASFMILSPNEPKLQDTELEKVFFVFFSDELLSLPLDRENEFSIDFLSVTPPISKVPYQMAIVELKDQL